MDKKGITYIVIVGIIALAGGWALGSFVTPIGGTTTPIRISGAGASFPAPLFQKWSLEFGDLTGIQVDYEAIGSGGGITQHTA